jgi:RNA polymerase sigma-70 factor (ECF subfamily)
MTETETARQFEQLVSRARAGDQEALAELVRQYEPKVRIVARVLLGPALRPYLDSLDLVQSVHRSLLGGLHEDRFNLTTPDNLIALALTMVRRKAARQWRRMQRQKRLEGTSGDTDLPDLLASLSTPGLDPSRVAQFNDQLQRLCAELDESERRILERRLQGYTTEEIASELGLNPGALRTRMTRLRQRLRAAGVLDDWL